MNEAASSTPQDLNVTLRKVRVLSITAMVFIAIAVLIAGCIISKDAEKKPYVIPLSLLSLVPYICIQHRAMRLTRCPSCGRSIWRFLVVGVLWVPNRLNSCPFCGKWDGA